MNCEKCGSVMMKFVDGFNHRRLYCRSCGRSSLDMTGFDVLMNFQDYKQNIHYKSRTFVRHGF